MDATTIAVDLAKDVFEIAISERPGHVSARRRVTRLQFGRFIDALDPSATVVMEACGTAHYWGRRCHSRGVTVRLLPPRYTRPYVRRQKTDRSDAEALLEAHRCTGIYAVPVKTVEQQTLQGLHRVRQQWMKTRTGRINLVRALLREQGHELPTGPAGLRRRVTVLMEGDLLPALTRQTVAWLLEELRALEAQLATIDRQILEIARHHPLAVRLQQIPGIGPLTATALVASVPPLSMFRTGRSLANWLGLTPRLRASGHLRLHGRMSKQGDPYLRTLLAHGARAVLASAPRHPGSWLHQWGLQVAARRGFPRAIIAVANKLARVVWVVGSRGCPFDARLKTL